MYRRTVLLTATRCVGASLLLASPVAAFAGTEKPGHLFDPDFVHPGGEKQMLRRFYVAREVVPGGRVEKMDFLLWQPDGRIDPDGYAKFCYAMRDVKEQQTAQIDMRLVAMMTTVQSYFWYRKRIEGHYYVTGGYRTWKTNDHTEGAAPLSEHTKGAAADGRIIGVRLSEQAAYMRDMGQGGVGLYMRRGFVHGDVGGKINFWRL